MGKMSKLSRNKRTERQKQRINEQPGRTVRNKLSKLKKHIKKYPNDKQAIGASDDTK